MKNICLYICLLILFTSCSKWLDVIPETQVSKEELFKTQEGFQEALNGLYSDGASQDLYGNEMTMGFLEVLAQNYNINFRDEQKYLQTQKYNYLDPDFISRKDKVWSGLYRAIANSNLILGNIEEKKNILTGVNYNIIKGEALALRAYFHFDILRMFAPSYLRGANAISIPYVRDFTNRVTPLSTVAQNIAHIIDDLTEARALLASVDPILDPQYVPTYSSNRASTEMTNQLLFLQNRRFRMNYYAVCATLARVNMYADNKTQALLYANEIIQAKKFPWTDMADFENVAPARKDRIMYNELIFSWYNPRNAVNVANRFTAGMTGLNISSDNGDVIYEKGTVGGNDKRFQQWLHLVLENNERRYEITKYSRDVDSNRHYLVAPAIRLSEMYYVAAESTFDTDPSKATAFVDSVRIHRGIPTVLVAPTKEVFLQEMLKEYRKEMYAEGQIFYQYKRLHRNIQGLSGAIHIADDKVFVLPVPDMEIEYGSR